MDPHIAVHGSFSVMVNYHAIGAYFTSRGGFALHNPQEEVCWQCYLVGPRDETYCSHDRSTNTSQRCFEFTNDGGSSTM